MCTHTHTHTRDEAWGYGASTSFQIIRCKLHRYANRFGCRLQGGSSVPENRPRIAPGTLLGAAEIGSGAIPGHCRGDLEPQSGPRRLPEAS